MHAMRGTDRWNWHSLPGRVAGSGLAGAAIGAAVAAVWNASWTSNPGYHVSAANVSEGVLLVDIDPSVPRPGASGITVVIGPAGGAWAAGELALCAGPGRSRPLYDACSACGPQRWLLTNRDPLLGDAALAESAGLVMESSTTALPTAVSDSTLIAAATSLRPASAASLAGLPG